MLASLLKGLLISGGGAVAVAILEAVVPGIIAKLDPTTGAVVGALFANVLNLLKLKLVDKK